VAMKNDNQEEHMEATHVHCFECDQYTEIEDGDDAESTPCFTCEDNGQDAFSTEAVAIIDCPNGVSAADWQPGGYKNGKDCDDESHEPRSGKHVVEVQ